MDTLLDKIDWFEIYFENPPPADGLPVATHKGMLRFGAIELRCYQLSDGRRVFNADDIHRVFGITIKQAVHAVTGTAR